SVCSFVCFFFQAEDGIRDFHVTGVQTCALPIYRDLVNDLLEQQEQESGPRGSEPQQGSDPGEQAAEGAGQGEPPDGGESQGDPRSEERRVGKEGRSRGSRWA